MSKSHSYRVQIHCDRQMYASINLFAEQRGLSQSAATRILIERALAKSNDEFISRLDKIDAYLESILHASTASRILSADAAQNSGSTLSGEDLRERITKLIARYKQF